MRITPPSRPTPTPGQASEDNDAPFTISKDKLQSVPQSNFKLEKALQKLIEQNLDVVFKCRLIATEFATGIQHAGRIDTLALSEDNNPVIIEYKKSGASELITQSLYYLAWIQDHHGDFEIAAQRALGNKVSVDWSDIRVICISPNYRKYDLHAAGVLGGKLELWTYRLYSDDLFYLEQVQQDAEAPTEEVALASGKNPVMVAAGRKAAATRASGSYTLEEHLNGKPGEMVELALEVQNYIWSLSGGIGMAPKKLYIAFRTSENIVCMEVQKRKVVLYLKLDPKKVMGPEGISRDVAKIGHYGTGDLEITLTTLADLEKAKPFIELAFRNVGD